jgi:hypothetical protein
MRITHLIIIRLPAAIRYPILVTDLIWLDAFGSPRNRDHSRLNRRIQRTCPDLNEWLSDYKHKGPESDSERTMSLVPI